MRDGEMPGFTRCGYEVATWRFKRDCPISERRSIIAFVRGSELPYYCE
jgi:hypothetical protein